VDLVSVKVGMGKTNARYRVGNPSELRKLMKIMHHTIVNTIEEAKQL